MPFCIRAVRRFMVLTSYKAAAKKNAITPDGGKEGHRDAVERQRTRH